VIAPQPLGGFVAHSLERDEGHSLPTRTRLLLDPGYFSFDWMVARGMNEVPGMSSSLEGGVSEILQSVQYEICRDLGEGFGSLRRLDHALRHGSLALSGKAVDLEPYQAVARAVATRAVRLMRNSLRYAQEIEEIVIVGGGSHYFQDSVKEEFPDRPIVVATDPITANVRGFQAIGKLLKSRKEL
jgi:plasmid segregation protein ParM